MDLSVSGDVVWFLDYLEQTMGIPTDPDGNDSSRPQRHCLEVTDGNRTSCSEIHLFRFKGRWIVTAYGPEGESIKFFRDEAGFVEASDSTEFRLRRPRSVEGVVCAVPRRLFDPAQRRSRPAG